MNKEQKELIRKLNLKSIVGCKEECKYNKAGQLSVNTQTEQQKNTSITKQDK